jgi:uncharacterized protein (TIGR02466 family)
MFNAGTARDVFPTKIYEAEFPNFDQVQDQILEAVIPYFNKPAEGNEYVTGNGQAMIIRTGNDLHKDPALKNVVDFIEFHAKEYWKQSELTSRIDPYILQLWANTIPPGGFTPAHNHNPVPMGGAFYINAVPKMGNLYLENPMENVIGKQPRDFQHKPYLYTETINVSPGKLIMFPGWMRHHTRSNMTQENRYVMGFNIGAWQTFMPKPTDP